MIVSAGFLMCRPLPDQTNSFEYFLVHPGGPFFAKKENGFWGIPKGLVEEKESPLIAAKREFFEETGLIPSEPFFELGEVKLKSGKRVIAWGFKTNHLGAIELKSNEFQIEWPPKSGQKKSFPEIDRGEFFVFEAAIQKISPAQKPFLDRLREQICSYRVSH